jgi:phospholipase/lecithinase/hemolysin
MVRVFIRPTFLIFLSLFLLTSHDMWALVSFDKIVTFGDSLSDPGNAYILWKRENTPPYDALDQFLIPKYPYAISHHHYCNGPTWVEYFATAHGLALNSQPAFLESNGEHMNFAVGRARARNAPDPDLINLPKQTKTFLRQVHGTVSKSTLCAIEIGANDIFDALEGNASSEIFSDALEEISHTIKKLYAHGARKFLIWNIPDIGKTPAVRSLDNIHPGTSQVSRALTEQFNEGIHHIVESLSKLDGIEIVELNVFQKFDQMVANPEMFGLSVVDVPCLIPYAQISHHENPDTYLFWDGIHPSKIFHKAVAQEAALVAARDKRFIP